MKISRPMSVLAFLIASTLIAQEAKVTPLMSKHLAELTCKVGFLEGTTKKTTGSRRKPADGHRNPSPRTRASAMACWQAPE